MSSIDAAISELYEKYESRIRKHIYGDFFKRYNLQDDVINEVFSIFLRRAKQNGNIEEAIVKFPYKLKNLILEAIRTVIEKQKGDIKLVPVESIRDFYEKVQRIVQEGYNEKEAKIMVRIEESILAHRVYVSRVSTSAITNSGGTKGSTSDDKNRDPWYDTVKPIDPNSTPATERDMIEKEKRAFFEDAFGICLEKMRKRKSKNAERDYQILKDHFFLETKSTHLARKYSLSDARISQIIKKGKEDVEKCVKKVLSLSP